MGGAAQFETSRAKMTLISFDKRTTFSSKVGGAFAVPKVLVMVITQLQMPPLL
jgi:hypothetical protein